MERSRTPTLVEVLQRRAEREPHEVVARRVEQVAPMRRVDVKEYTGDHDRLLFQQLFKERQPVVDRVGQTLQVEPHVERRARGHAHLEAHLPQPTEHVVTLVVEVLLERELLLVHACGVQKRDCRELQRVVRSTVEEGAGLGERGDQVLGPDYPADAPARETPVLWAR